ncbi:MAG TPA: cereblon family protein [Gammaproteobacteria bacterium]|nr:cereblon family protein [Gammaproteobacteria bacterium]
MDGYNIRLRLLEKTGSPLQNLLHKLKYAAMTDPDAAIRCAACLQTITSHRERFEIGGASEHFHTNPQGLRFHIICYREARGCRNMGEPTGLHTWFPGYDWCYALCGNCHAHLGWYYSAANGGGFYGLIKDRLLENPAPRAGN